MQVSYQCKRCMAPVHQHWRHASLALFHQVDSKLLNADWMKTHLQEWVMSMQCTHGYTVYEKRMYVCLYWLWSTDYVQMCEILWNKYSFILSPTGPWHWASRKQRRGARWWSGYVGVLCIGKLTIIGSDNGLSPGRCQTIIWNNGGILLIGPLGTNLSEILIEIQIFSLKKMRLKMSSAKCWPFRLCLNVLKIRIKKTSLIKKLLI